MSDFQLQRLGMLMEPEPGNPNEIEGVLNPAATRGPDGKLYLFPRLVAKNNYSRIGIARVKFNEAGDPSGVERLGIALEPEADYERRSDGSGGCEDARVTFVEPLQHYVMTYTALSPSGPRIALAMSEDLFHWERIGLATFEPFQGIDFVHVDNKDASIFPVAIPNHAGKMQLALLHRPLFPGTRPEETALQGESRIVDREHESIWISYCPMPPKGLAPHRPGLFNSHHRLATPVSPWEKLKIGGGTPPILTKHGWLILYHGVSKMAEPGSDGRQLCYSAGVMVLSKEHPCEIRYRSAEPVLTPELPQERHGTIANVVFPTGIDRRDDLGSPDRFDVYYGMADNRIGVARLDLPEQEQKIATNAYRLLHNWQQPPGTTNGPAFDGKAFSKWLAEGKAKTKESGHFRIAMSQIGQVLAHTPPDPDGLWIHRAVADALNDKDAGDMRSGFTMKLFNLRGVHGFSAGKEELAIAEGFHKKAEALEENGFQRIATAMRELAKGYERDAEREAQRNPYGE